MRINNDFGPKNTAWDKMMSLVKPQIDQRTQQAQQTPTKITTDEQNEAATYAPSERAQLAQAFNQRFEALNSGADEEVHDANELEMEAAMKVEGPATLAAKKQAKFEEMDRLLAMDPRKLSEEELESVREFLKSDDLDEYLSRLDGDDILTMDVQSNVEKFSAQTARIRQNLDAYFKGTDGSADVKERIEGRMEDAAGSMADKITDVVAKYTGVNNGPFDSATFREVVGDVLSQRVSAYDSEYAAGRISNADDARSVRAIVEGRGAVQGSIFRGISSETEALGEVTYKDVVEFTDFLSKTERELVEGRQKIYIEAGFTVQEDGSLVALDESGEVRMLIPDNTVAHKLGTLYGSKLFDAEQMAHNPFGETIYKAVEGRVEHLINDDLSILKDALGGAVNAGTLTQKEADAAAYSFEFVLKNAIAELSSRYKQEHADELEELNQELDRIGSDTIQLAAAKISAGI